MGKPAVRIDLGSDERAALAGLAQLEHRDSATYSLSEPALPAPNRGSADPASTGDLLWGVRMTLRNRHLGKTTGRGSTYPAPIPVRTNPANSQNRRKGSDRICRTPDAGRTESLTSAVFTACLR